MSITHFIKRYANVLFTTAHIATLRPCMIIRVTVQDEVISAVLANIDGRVTSILTLNSSLATTHAQIDDNIAAQRSTIVSDQYIESYSILRSFVRNVMYYASADNEAQKSSLIDKGRPIDKWLVMMIYE